jgi:hypothetical protein
MPKDPESSSWWQTLPGVLTAIAALITAVGGLLAVLVQTGVIHGSRGTSAADRDSTRYLPATAVSSAYRPPPAPSGALRPWSESEAVITDANNVATVVRAETLSNCISVNQVLTLNGSQDIPFERMRSFEIVRVDPFGAPQAKATVAITLLDGRVLHGQIDAMCNGIFGYNDLGRYEILLQALKRVEFRR